MQECINKEYLNKRVDSNQLSQKVRINKNKWSCLKHV